MIRKILTALLVIPSWSRVVVLHRTGDHVVPIAFKAPPGLYLSTGRRQQSCDRQTHAETRSVRDVIYVLIPNNIYLIAHNPCGVGAVNILITFYSFTNSGSITAAHTPCMMAVPLRSLVRALTSYPVAQGASRGCSVFPALQRAGPASAWTQLSPQRPLCSRCCKALQSIPIYFSYVLLIIIYETTETHAFVLPSRPVGSPALQGAGLVAVPAWAARFGAVLPSGLGSLRYDVGYAVQPPSAPVRQRAHRWVTV